MSATAPFDVALAHKWFAADCFNAVWALLEKKDRLADDDERMISLCHASLAHWRERSDCAARKLSIGYWQLARVYAVVGQAANAKHYGELCLTASAGDEPFYLGFAHEALARAAKVAGDADGMQHHMVSARELAARVVDADERKMLENDLAELSA